jgi:DNA invertase Pin-like site-specific DNA recombinase
VTLRATEQPIDTSTPAGKAFLDMLGVFAEFETAIRKERQMEGIAKAKAGVYKGGEAGTDPMATGVKPDSRRGLQNGDRGRRTNKSLRRRLGANHRDVKRAGVEK